MTTPAPALAPSPEQVHALIARRGVFTETSKPSREAVETIAAQLAGELAAEVKGGAAAMPADLALFASSVLAYGVASLVELSYFPEQAFDAGSTSEQLRTRYLEALKRLRQLLAEAGVLRGGADDGAGGGELPARRPRVGSIRVTSGTAPERLVTALPVASDPIVGDGMVQAVTTAPSSSSSSSSDEQLVVTEPA